MAHHDAVIFRVTAGRNDGAAVPRRVRRRDSTLLLIKPRDVVVGKFLDRVERNDVPAVGFDLRIVQPAHNSIDFALILGINFRPQDVPRNFPIELPVVFRLVMQERFDDSEKVLGLFRQQMAVLIANLFRRAFEVHVDPAITIEAVAASHSIIFGNRGLPLGKPERRNRKHGERDDDQRDGFGLHVFPFECPLRFGHSRPFRAGITTVIEFWTGSRGFFILSIRLLKYRFCFGLLIVVYGIYEGNHRH